MKRILILCLLGGMVACQSVVVEKDKKDLLTAADVVAFKYPEPYTRIPYGSDSEQFADLRVPEGQGPHPVMIWIHGGCWLAEYGGVSPSGRLVEAFTRNGIATWTIEYRRVGNAGGGWPGTFQDVARAADKLLEVAPDYNLDTSRVIVGGHSAGGHLALWLGARRQFVNNSLFSAKKQIPLKGVLGLAPAPDLAFLHRVEVCDGVVDKLMGGSPEAFPERYEQASATELTPIGLPQVLLSGLLDEWREPAVRYHDAAKAAGDKQVEFISIPDAGHFEMLNPDSITWPQVLNAAYGLLDMVENR